MAKFEGVPTRADVIDRWTAIIEGRSTREEVHAWAEPLMFGEKIEDVMGGSALQHLHGFADSILNDAAPDPHLS